MEKYNIVKKGAGFNGSDLTINLAAPSGIGEFYSVDKRTAQIVLNALNREARWGTTFKIIKRV